jgi:hypothetical protein
LPTNTPLALTKEFAETKYLNGDEPVIDSIYRHYSLVILTLIIGLVKGIEVVMDLGMKL